MKKFLLVTFCIIIFFLILLFLVSSSGILFKLFAPIKDSETARKNGEELLNQKGKVVAVAAHPDDLEYWLGGTLGELSKRGNEIIAIICTDNKNNGDVRQAEQKRAGKILGYKEIIFLEFPDGNLIDHQVELEDKLSNLFIKINPEIIFTFDIEKEGIIYHHKDHETVGKITLEIVQELRPEHIYFFHTSLPNTLVNITDIIDKKIEAFLAYESQKKSLPLIGNRLVVWHLCRMSNIYENMIDVKYAESFRRGW